MRAVPHLNDWARTMAERHGHHQVLLIAARIQERHQDLLSAGPTGLNRTLQPQWENLLLPGLPLNQTLAEYCLNQQAALSEVDALFKSGLFLPSTRCVALLNLLTDPLPVIRPLLRRLMKNTYLPDAQQVVEDSPTGFAVNVYR